MKTMMLMLGLLVSTAAFAAPGVQRAGRDEGRQGDRVGRTMKGPAHAKRAAGHRQHRARTEGRNHGGKQLRSCDASRRFGRDFGQRHGGRRN